MRSLKVRHQLQCIPYCIANGINLQNLRRKPRIHTDPASCSIEGTPNLAPSIFLKLNPVQSSDLYFVFGFRDNHFFFFAPLVS